MWLAWSKGFGEAGEVSKEDEQAGLVEGVSGARRVSGRVWVLGLAGLLLMYPLSVGPVGYVYGREDLGAPRQVEVRSLMGFRPLTGLGDQVPVLGEVIDWYFQAGYFFGSGQRLGPRCGTKF